MRTRFEKAPETLNLVFHVLNGGKQKRAAARSRAHEVRAYAAHLGVRQTKPPVTQTSFRPKTFSLNFLIE